MGDTWVSHIQHSDPAVVFIAFSRTQPTCRPQKGGNFSLMCEESLVTSEGSQEQHCGGFTVYWSVKYQFIFCYCFCLKLVPFSKEMTRTIHQFLLLLLFIITSLAFLFCFFQKLWLFFQLLKLIEQIKEHPISGKWHHGCEQEAAISQEPPLLHICNGHASF